MIQPDLPDAQRRDTLMSEARRVASSGKYATWHEVQDALAADDRKPDEVRLLFAEDTAFREEIEALAESAHGVGGPATE